MSSPLRAARPYAALVAAAALGGGVAVGAVALLGGLEGDTTVVTETTAAPSAQSAPTAGRALNVNEIYERAAPGVVQITTMSGSGVSLPAGRALGSGFVVDKAGHIVTNYHVIETGSSEIRVSFSNRDTVEAELVGSDPSTDLAVLRVDTSANALTPLSLGNSDAVEVGDPVVAIGNPFGLDRTATAGIVSALQRLITAPNQFTIDHVMVDGELFYQHEPSCKQVVEPEIAHLVTAMIQGGVQHGTGTAAALSPWPVAGKTGTTQDYSNVWFVGLTRQVSTAVWVGFPGTPDSLELYFGRGVFGGTIAAPIWHDYMARIMAGMPAEPYDSTAKPRPSGCICDFMSAMFSRVHLAGATFLSMAAFSAGRPKASQPIGIRTLQPFMRS